MNIPSRDMTAISGVLTSLSHLLIDRQGNSGVTEAKAMQTNNKQQEQSLLCLVGPPEWAVHASVDRPSLATLGETLWRGGWERSDCA